MNVGGPVLSQQDLPPTVAQDGRVKLLTAYFGAMPCLGCANHPGKWCNGVGSHYI